MSIFNQVQLQKPKSNTFNLSHDVKMSLKMGRIVPIDLIECIPGDTHKLSTSYILRMAPMLAPIMHQIKVYTHHFFVPNRLVWKNWEDFITGGEDGTALPSFPTAGGAISEGTIGDYLGLPTDMQTTEQFSVIPGAGYNLIWNEYFRDQNLGTEYETQCQDGTGGNNVTIRTTYQAEPFKRAWAHDYFTSALPWTQKGVEATIPLGTNAPLYFDTNNGNIPNRLVDGNGNPLAGPQDTLFGKVNANDYTGTIRTDAGVQAFIDNSSKLKVDLSQATASSIIDLRRAFKLQEWLERNARGGSRYVESMLAHFGVRSSDKRLQRPEFIGGSVSQIKVSEIAQTSANMDDVTSPATLYGYGLSTDSTRTFKYYAEEHGYIFSFISVMPKGTYQQGIPKTFLKNNKFDYYYPSFAHIGEQPIYNKELWVGPNPNENDEVFGYTPRYAEYKFKLNRVAGSMRGSLDYWHMGRKFQNKPVLNEDFISCDPTERIFFVENNTEHIYAHIYNKVKSRRLMPYFGNPKL